MPYFSKCCGADEYICQKCGKILCGQCHPSEWRSDITHNEHAGNVCPDCLRKFAPKSPISNSGKITKKMIKEYIQAKIKTDERWLCRALLKIYAFQTAEERADERTRYNNSVGFTGFDAPYLSSLAVHLRDKGWLSAKQKSQLKKMMPKYWQQIADISNKEKLYAQILASQEIVQYELILK